VTLHGVCGAVYTEWHLATQVLYFVAAVLLLVAEIFGRVQLCCDERKSVYWALSIIALVSGTYTLCTTIYDYITRNIDSAGAQRRHTITAPALYYNNAMVRRIFRPGTSCMKDSSSLGA